MLKKICWVPICIGLLLLTQACKDEVKPFDTQYLPEGVSRMEFQHFSAIPKKIDMDRIHPPHWWTGMEHDTIELLIYSQNIAKYDLNFSIPGCKLIERSFVQNTNYLFLKIHIGENAAKGNHSISFQKGENSKQFEFEIKNRRKNHIKPLNNEDRVYLIFPDRFANGNPKNDSFEHMRQTGTDRSKMYFRHGGDIQGIINKLDYIKDLGFTAIWLNPVYINDQPYSSYHGYALTDHYLVDPRFGANEKYRELSDSCESKGIKLIKDIIPNHVGFHHWFVQDIPDENWIHQNDSYVPCNHAIYSVLDDNSNEKEKLDFLQGWFDVSMPDLNQKNPKLATYLIQNYLWWIEEFGIDGYRVDTYHYSYAEFLEKWIRSMRHEYPNLFIFGEVWMPNPSMQSVFTTNGGFTGANPIDGITDFSLTNKIINAMKQDNNGYELFELLVQEYLYPKPENNIAVLDNHDMHRIFSVLNEDFDLFKSAFTLLYSMPRIPIVYYGTEVLHKNFKEPDGLVRSDMEGGWLNDQIDKFSAEGRTEIEEAAFQHIQKLNKLRSKHDALSNGSFEHLRPRDGIYAFKRAQQNEEILIFFNGSNESKEINISSYFDINPKQTRFWDMVENKSLNSDFIIPSKSTCMIQFAPKN